MFTNIGSLPQGSLIQSTYGNGKKKRVSQLKKKGPPPANGTSKQVGY